MDAFKIPSKPLYSVGDTVVVAKICGESVDTRIQVRIWERFYDEIANSHRYFVMQNGESLVTEGNIKNKLFWESELCPLCSEDMPGCLAKHE